MSVTGYIILLRLASTLEPPQPGDDEVTTTRSHPMEGKTSPATLRRLRGPPPVRGNADDTQRSTIQCPRDQTRLETV